MRSAATTNRLERRPMWYAPHQSLKKQSTARSACVIVERIAANADLGPELTEKALFVAMHACAFQASLRRSPLASASRAARSWSTRWEILRSHIVNRNLGLVHAMVSRIRQEGADHDDLISEAMLALVRAVDRYNPWKGFRFSTYACNVIIRALVRRCKSQCRRQQHFPVIDVAAMDYSQDSAEALDDGLYLERLQRTIRDNSCGLTPIEFKVLAARFPSGTAVAPMTFREIGNLVKLSKERVRQIQGVALGKLHVALTQDPILS